MVAHGVLGTCVLVLALGAGAARTQDTDEIRTDPRTEVEVSAAWTQQVTADLRRAEYLFSARAIGESTAPNRAQALRCVVSARGLEVFPRSAASAEEAAWRVTLGTTSFGREGETLPLGEAGITGSPDRVTLAHGDLEEWFINDERGIEQGWTIGIRPLGDPLQPVWIGLEFGGDLALRIDGGGRSGTLFDGQGTPRLRYHGLQAWDARGEELVARLVSSPHGVGIRIDDAGAVYPVTVDPILSSAVWTAKPDQADSQFGWDASTAGDVNGDGFSDVIVGARFFDNGQVDEGVVFVYLGSASGPEPAASWTAEIDQSGALFGGAVSTAGDVNGDGYDDVIIGAARYANGETQEGAAFVYLGSASGLETTASWSAESDQAVAIFGAVATTAGDVNGDGYDDVIVGARLYDNGESNEGAVFGYLGSASGLEATASWSAESDQVDADFGVHISPAGDVNGDGYADVIVGARYFDNGESQEGAAFAYLGSSSGLSASHGWMVEGNQAIAQLGHSVSTAGDVNGDGYADVIVGALSFTNGEASEGTALAYLGSSSGLDTTPAWSVEGNQISAQMGQAISTAGDLNGDGYADVIIGARLFDNGETNEGAVFAYLGSATGLETTPSWTAEGDQAGAQFGYSVSTAGDVNGDGFSDLLVGALFYDDGETDEGAAFVYLGSAASLETDASWSVETNQASTLDEGAYWKIATAGDVNGDGFSDVIVGAHEFDNGEAEEGRAWVYHGSAAGLEATVAWSAEGDQDFAYFGFPVSSAGDVNGDGYDDVIVGAFGYDNGQVDEGRAYVYHGSPNGLLANASWMAEGDADEAQFGWSLDGAGDVNGDGFADVIVGVPEPYNLVSKEGRACVYLGSASGLGAIAAWTAIGETLDDQFGFSVSTAGDANGDGFSDVIIGAPFFSNGASSEGCCYVYFGSSTGLEASPSWRDEGGVFGGNHGILVNDAGDMNGDGLSDVLTVGAGTKAYFGATSRVLYHGWGLNGPHNVATAGDVNGDGYSDVISGDSRYDNGETNEGRAAVHPGAAGSVVFTSEIWAAESNQVGAELGIGVSTAGDVNGDGFSDVIASAPFYDNGQTDEGAVFLYLGNDGGLALAPRQRRTDDSRPIALLGKTNRDSAFLVRAQGRTPAGRARLQLEVEVKDLDEPFDGTDLRESPPTEVGGLLGVQDVELVLYDNVFFGRPYRWRARLVSDDPFFPRSPWFSIPGNAITETKLRTGTPQLSPPPKGRSGSGVRIGP